MEQRLKTEEETKREVAEMIVAVVAAHMDATRKGFGKGNGGIGSMPCPRNCGGLLRYSITGSNGHMAGKCSTPKCLRWIE